MKILILVQNLHAFTAKAASQRSVPRIRSTLKRKHLAEMHDCGNNIYEEESTTMVIQSIQDNSGAAIDRVFCKKDIRNETQTDNSVVVSSRENSSSLAMLLKELIMMYQATSISCKREFDIAPTFHAVVSLACAHPRSVIVKACVVSIADMRGKQFGYSVLFQRIWSAYLNPTSHPGHRDALLRIYSELAVDCNAFDGDSKLCWTIVRPLVKHTKYTLSVNKNNEQFSCTSLIRAIGHIFVYRRRCLSEAGINIYMQDIVEIFEQKDLWLNIPLIPIDERISLLYSLMTAGVLSLLSSVGDLPQSKEVCEEWPFEMGSRLATHTIHLNDVKQLLSAHKEPGVVPISSHFDNDMACTIFDGEPLHDYLSNDVIRVVVSYLGFRNVLKAAAVCKNWNSLCTENHLWRRLFKTRWKKTIEGISFDWEDCSWRDLFIRKLKKERSIRGRVSAAGWKHVVCNHPECLVVIRSENQFNAHNRKHENDEAKFVERELKKMGLVR